MNNSIRPDHIQSFYPVLRCAPNAEASITGSDAYPAIRGKALFYQTSLGVLVSVWVFGLPTDRDSYSAPFFAFHLHSGTACTGDSEDAFRDALTHYNPKDCLHPNHTGDFPPLLANHGMAFSVFLTDRFSVDEIIGKTVIIHADPDDFTTQPSGNAGTKIACGQIRRNRCCGRSFFL